AQAEKALAQAAALAEAGRGVTGSGAGASAVARLKERVARLTAGLSAADEIPAAAADLLRAGEGGDLSSWLEKMRGAAYERIDRGAVENLSKSNAPFTI